MNKFGLESIKIDGIESDVRGSVEVGLGKDSGEEMVGIDKFHGVKYTPNAPYLQFEISDSSELSFDDLAEVNGATVVTNCINGKQFILQNASNLNVDGGVYNPEEGTMTVRLVGEKMIAV